MMPPKVWASIYGDSSRQATGVEMDSQQPREQLCLVCGVPLTDAPQCQTPTHRMFHENPSLLVQAQGEAADLEAKLVREVSAATRQLMVTDYSPEAERTARDLLLDLMVRRLAAGPALKAVIDEYEATVEALAAR